MKYVVTKYEVICFTKQIHGCISVEKTVLNHLKWISVWKRVYAFSRGSKWSHSRQRQGKMVRKWTPRPISFCPKRWPFFPRLSLQVVKGKGLVYTTSAIPATQKLLGLWGDLGRLRGQVRQKQTPWGWFLCWWHQKKCPTTPEKSK